jgi:hypothetical protein
MNFKKQIVDGNVVVKEKKDLVYWIVFVIFQLAFLCALLTGWIEDGTYFVFTAYFVLLMLNVMFEKAVFVWLNK